MAKKKRILTPIGSVRQQFRRRIARVSHVGLFLAAQFAIWLWWLAEHMRTGDGFHANFFWDRVIILVGWGVLLFTHIWIMKLLNERDQQIAALMDSQFEGENEVIQPRAINMRRLEDAYSDENAGAFTDEEPTRNQNHR
jgi:hypothetical protein